MTLYIGGEYNTSVWIIIHTIITSSSVLLGHASNASGLDPNLVSSTADLEETCARHNNANTTQEKRNRTSAYPNALISRIGKTSSVW